MHFKIALFPFWLTSATTDSVLTLARVLNLVGARPKYPFFGNFVFVLNICICRGFLYLWRIFVFVPVVAIVGVFKPQQRCLCQTTKSYFACTLGWDRQQICLVLERSEWIEIRAEWKSWKCQNENIARLWDTSQLQNIILQIGPLSSCKIKREVSDKKRSRCVTWGLRMISSFLKFLFSS